jgi:hypothetical protein
MTHLLLNVVQRVWRVDSEADEDDMGVRVTEWAESVIIFLTSRIPQGQLDMFTVNVNVGDVVFEYGGNIDLEWRRLNVKHVPEYGPLGRCLLRRQSTSRSWPKLVKF